MPISAPSRQSHCARGDFFDFGTSRRQLSAASSTSRVMQPETSAPYCASAAFSQQVRRGIPYCRPMAANAWTSRFCSSNATVLACGKLRFVFSYRSIKLTTQELTYPESAAAIFSKLRRWYSGEYFAVINTGSYRQPTAFAPICADSCRTDSNTCCFSGTNGSISLP